MKKLASLTHLALRSHWGRLLSSGPATGTEVSGTGRKYEMLAALRHYPRLATQATRAFRHA